MYCKKCGKEIPDGANFCKHCGAPNTDAEQGPIAVARCPKCGGTNVTFVREQAGTFGGSAFRAANVGHGCLYWLFIGWWWRPIRFICYGWFLDLFKFFGFGVNASVSKNRTVAVCQRCGNTWKVKK